MECKYVILDWLGDIKAIILDPTLNHDFVVSKDLAAAVISAGRCKWDKEKGWGCYGFSQSFGKQSRGQIDSEILNKMIND